MCERNEELQPSEELQASEEEAGWEWEEPTPAARS